MDTPKHWMNKKIKKDPTYWLYYIFSIIDLDYTAYKVVSSRVVRS